MQVVASAPAKVILFGEHAVNRGQTALAVSIGLRATCRTTPGCCLFHLEGGGHARTYTLEEIVSLGAQVDAWRESQNYEAIRQLAATDFFAPAQYIIAHMMRVCDDLEEGLDIAFESAIPNSGGLGSGGAANVALTRALAELCGIKDIKQIGRWAYLGDVIAHGGVASALDTQTSLLGGLIRYTRESWGEPVACAPGLSLVIGDTGIRGQTSEVNTRVHQWLAADHTRMRYFEMIGVLSVDALRALEIGDWRLVGKLMNINQLVLEKIGVSCPELERLIDAAIGAGALGAKLSGSGGGGIMIALATDETREAVAWALRDAGARAIYTPEVAVNGVRIEK
jgi:mevalonate kinase